MSAGGDGAPDPLVVNVRLVHAAPSESLRTAPVLDLDAAPCSDVAVDDELSVAGQSCGGVLGGNGDGLVGVCKG